MTATLPLPIETLHDGQNLYFTAPQMLAYGAACAMAEREACIDAVKTEMQRWIGQCDVTDFRLAIAVIRARKDTHE